MKHEIAHGVTQAPAVQPEATRRQTAWWRYAGSLVIAVMLAILGCSGGEEPTLTGTWTGTITDNLAGVGSVLFTMTQTGGQLTGTWQSTFADPTNNNGGTLSGTISGNAIALTLTSTLPQACSFTVAATRDGDDDNHFTGTYTASSCTRVENGSLDVRRQ